MGVLTFLRGLVFAWRHVDHEEIYSRLCIFKDVGFEENNLGGSISEGNSLIGRGICLIFVVARQGDGLV